MSVKIKEALTFDDILIEPSYSDILPTEVDTKSKLTRNISLNIPLISSAMDTVTEYQMAIAMAQAGGIGVIHKNLSIDEQAEEVRKVKRYESGMVVDPICLKPTFTLEMAKKLMDIHKISGMPVVDNDTQKLVGILTNRDVRFATDLSASVDTLMTKNNLITVEGSISHDKARELLHQYRIEKLIVVDEHYHCTGLITYKDIDKAITNPLGNKDNRGRLLVAAAIGATDESVDRAKALLSAGVDVLVIDTAHGHSKNVIEMIKKIKGISNIDIIAGNVATPRAAKTLINAGADGIKVGIGPGSICTTRVIAGIGMPQFTAILETAEICNEENVPCIADGGIRSSGDIVKALAAGASSVMIGSMLAGTTESPGEEFLYQGRAYKSYRGMGSIAAMAAGSADRYGQASISLNKLVPEGIEAQVPVRGDVNLVLHQLVGGLRSGLGYVGATDILDLQLNAIFRKITNAGLKENHPHDVSITKGAPNYSQE
jgi:IMP dehydrogenase